MHELDLRGQSKLITKWSYDEELDEITIQYWDATDTTQIGEFKLEGQRFRSYTQSMDEISRHFFPDALNLTTRQGHITQFNGETHVATTEWTP